jgi:hypothetical protein
VGAQRRPEQNRVPNRTTIPSRSSQAEAVTDLFTQVLLTCDSPGLIGGDMFAIDGCKITSNAAKEWPGTTGDITGWR